MKKIVKDKLSGLMADSDNVNFGTRPEIACSLPCPIAKPEKDELKSRNFTYTWGSGSQRCLDFAPLSPSPAEDRA